MKKKKCWLWLLFIFMFALSMFSVTACTDKNGEKPYFGTYKSGWGDTLIITEEYVSVDGENHEYTITDGRIRIEGYSAELIFYNNYQVLSFAFALAEFDSGSITERNQYFNATLYNYGNGGILEAYLFNSDGTASYVNASNPTQNKSATYRIKDGVIEITFMQITTFETNKTYWYVTENGQIYYDVYIKDVDTYFNYNNENNSNHNGNLDNENSSSDNDNGNTDNENSSPATRTFTLNYSVNNSAYGYVTGDTTQNVDEYSNGTSVTAVAKDGYRFVGWSDGVKTATRQEKNVTNNIIVTANFELIPTYTIEYFANENGSIVGTTSQLVKEGENSSSVTAVPDEGYRFVGWSDGVTTATRQEKDVTDNLSITAYFELIPTYTIEYCANENGSIVGETNQLVKEGKNSTSVTAVPDEGYRFVGWSDGVKTATRQDFNIVSHINVTACFEVIEYTYTYKVQVSGGTSMGRLNGSQQTELKMNGSILNGYQGASVTAYPAQDCYKFVGWSDGVKDNPRIDRIESNQEITAYFKRCYKFTFVAGEGGTIQGERYQEVDDGNYTTAVTAVANGGYEFWGWHYQQYSVDHYFWSETISINTKDMLFENTYTAIFKKVEYSAKYNSSSGGVIKYDYTPFDQNANNYNADGVSSVTFTISIDNQFNAPQVTATPKENYRFVKWSDGNTSPTRQDLNLNGNLEVKAEFVKIYKIHFVAEEGGTIEGELYQEIDEGGETTAVTAVANAGYKFWGWHYQQYNVDHYLWSETIIISSNDWTLGDTYTAIFKKV